MTRAVLGCVGIVMGLVLHLTITSAAEGPSRHVVDVGGARIEIIAEGQGPLIVLLPSTGRGPDDFDVLAGGLAQAGFRVLHPRRDLALRYAEGSAPAPAAHTGTSNSPNELRRG